MPNNMKQWYKWCLVVDDMQLPVPTREHGIRLGRYLKGFGVPVRLSETVLTIEKDSGGINVADKTTNDISYLIDAQNNVQNS